MVSGKRTRIINGNIQRGHKRGRYHRGAVCAVGHASAWVALGLLDYWRARILLAHPVARVLPRTGETPSMFESRTCVHKERSAATGGEDSVVAAFAAPADMGVRG